MNQAAPCHCEYCETARIEEAPSSTAALETLVRNAVTKAVRRNFHARSLPKTLVGVSVRHIHVTQRHLEVLYGPGARLHKLRDLYQEGFFAAKETVTLIGPKLRAMEGVRILGPCRTYSQVELARTDAIRLGMRVPARASGDLSDASMVTIVGPAGSVTLEHGAIRNIRHIHMSPEEASGLGLRHKQRIDVEVPGELGLVLRNVEIQIGRASRMEMHIDTDDANAAGVLCGDKLNLLL